MGFFDRFRKKAPPAAEAEPEPAPEPEPEPAAVVVLREGMSPPSEEDMKAVLSSFPELAELPRRGLAQPRWWRQDDWVASGMRGIGAALREELRIDPDKTTWKLTRDERGARVGVVILYK